MRRTRAHAAPVARVGCCDSSADSICVAVRCDGRQFVSCQPEAGTTENGCCWTGSSVLRFAGSTQPRPMRTPPGSIGLLLLCLRGCHQWCIGRRKSGRPCNGGWRPFRHRSPRPQERESPIRGTDTQRQTGQLDRGEYRGRGLHFLRGESQPPVAARPPRAVGLLPSSARRLLEAPSLVKSAKSAADYWKRRLWLSDTFRGRRGVSSAGKSAALSERLLFVFLLYPFRPVDSTQEPSGTGGVD